MNARRVLRVEPAQLFEAAPGAGLKALEPHLNGMLDSRVVADVEMKERNLFEGAPVAAVHGDVIADIECAGDDFAIALRPA